MDAWTSVKDEFYVEALFVFAVIVYLGNYFYARASMSTRMKAWSDSVQSTMQKNFTLTDSVSLSETSRIDHASGGANHSCEYWQSRVDLQAQHELVLGVVWPVIMGGSDSVDKVTIDIKIPAKNNVFYVLALCQRDAQTSMKKDRWDMQTYATSSTSTELPSSLCVLSDNAGMGVLDVLLKDPLVTRSLHEFQQNSSPLLQVLVSDQPEEEPTSVDQLSLGDVTFRLVFKLPAHATQVENQAVAICEFSLYLLDLINSTSPSFELRQKTIKQRTSVREVMEKKTTKKLQEEALEASKDRQRQKIKDIDNLPPAQRKKAEEKLQNKLIKKRTKKIKA